MTEERLKCCCGAYRDEHTDPRGTSYCPPQPTHEQVEKLKKQLKQNQHRFFDMVGKYANALIRAEEAEKNAKEVGWIKEAASSLPEDEITTKELRELEIAERKASPAPWSGEAQQPSVWMNNADGKKIADIDAYVGRGFFDLEVIVGARNKLPKLIKTIRRNRIALKEILMRHALGDCTCGGCSIARAALEGERK